MPYVMIAKAAKKGANRIREKRNGGGNEDGLAGQEAAAAPRTESPSRTRPTRRVLNRVNARVNKLVG